MRFITPEKHEILQKGHLRTNDVLITTRGNIGTAGIVPADFEDANINAQLVLLRCEGDKIDPHYLIWVFSLPEIHEQLNNLTTGTALQQLPVGNLYKLKIPLPPLTEQKRIASLLARADRLRQLRRTAHDLGDALLQSVFLEMFGKVRGKTKEVLLGEIADIASGVTKGQNYNGRKTVEVPYLRVANVQDGYLDLSIIKTIQALPSEI